MVLVSHGIACRAATGEMPSHGLMNADGSEPLLPSRGFNDRGTDQSLWVRELRPRDSLEEGHIRVTGVSCLGSRGQTGQAAVQRMGGQIGECR